MRARSLKDITKQIKKETAEQIQEYQYQIYSQISAEIFRVAFAVIATVMYRRGRSEKYVQKLLDDFVSILEYPCVLGHQLTSDEVKEFVCNHYNIDLSKITPILETKEEMKERFKHE